MIRNNITVGFHNINLRIFNLRVSNPSKLIVDVFLVRCRISMCQGLGPKKHDEISEIDHKNDEVGERLRPEAPLAASSTCTIIIIYIIIIIIYTIIIITSLSLYIYIYIYIYIYREREICIHVQYLSCTYILRTCTCL